MTATSVTREMLRYAARFRGMTVLLTSSGIGPFNRDDLGMLLQDVTLLRQVGMDFCVAEYRGVDFWSGLAWPDDVPSISVRDDDELIAEALKRGAQKICLVAGTDRIVIGDKHLDSVPLADAERFLGESMKLAGQVRHALELAVSACTKGIPRVHIVNAHRDGALLDELFTNLGVGTMIFTGTPHKEIRRMTDADRFSVCTLVRSVVPKRTPEFVGEHADEWRIFAVDGDVHGVARFRRQEKCLVVLTLAYASRANKTDVIEYLLRAAAAEARSLEVDSVALPGDEIPALMRILPWFTGLGFAKGTISFGAGPKDAWLQKVA
jgi:hypothetical protein